MSRPMPDVLDETQLPLVVLRAAALDGDVYAIGEAYRPVDLPEEPASRAAALAGIAVRERILAGPTAAWVWGARPAPGIPYTVTVPHGSGVGHAQSTVVGGVRVREQQVRATDIVQLAGVSVTTPLRTALDLIRVAHPEWERDVIEELLRGAGVSVAAFGADLLTRHRLPGSAIAMARTQVLVTR